MGRAVVGISASDNVRKEMTGASFAWRDLSATVFPKHDFNCRPLNAAEAARGDQPDIAASLRSPNGGKAVVSADETIRKPLQSLAMRTHQTMQSHDMIGEHA